MKISSFGKHPGDPVSPPVKKTSSKDFSSFMDMANRDKQEQHLKEMLDKIMKLGEKIKAAPILKDIKEYKRQISDYLTFVLKNYYKVSRDYLYSSSNILLRVDVLNKKIDELVHQFLENQKDNLRLIKSVDEISGLLLDLYN